nr:hypothetical protein [bacterium]
MSKKQYQWIQIGLVAIYILFVLFFFRTKVAGAVMLLVLGAAEAAFSIYYLVSNKRKLQKTERDMEYRNLFFIGLMLLYAIVQLARSSI